MNIFIGVVNAQGRAHAQGCAFMTCACMFMNEQDGVQPSPKSATNEQACVHPSSGVSNKLCVEHGGVEHGGVEHVPKSLFPRAAQAEFR